MNALPFHLIEQIKLGNAILFLGAGASIGTRYKNNKPLPNGRQLADSIIDNFLGSEYAGADLGYASELAISTSSLFEVQDFIASTIKPIEPEPFHH